MRNKTACTTASTVPPNTFPNTSDPRGTGETSTACKKPSRRSSMIEIVEKMAVKSKISTATPGRKYSW